MNGDDSAKFAIHGDAREGRSQITSIRPRKLHVRTNFKPAAQVQSLLNVRLLSP